MKIQAKIVFLIALLIIFFTNVIYGLLRWQIERYHHDIEKRYITRNIARCQTAIAHEQEILLQILQMWKDRESNERVPGFRTGLQERFSADFIISFAINNNNLIDYNLLHKTDELGTALNTEDAFASLLSQNFAHVSSVDSSFTGILLFQNNPVLFAMFASEPETGHNAKGLLAATFLNDEFMGNISSHLQEEVNIFVLLENQAPDIKKIAEEVESYQHPKILYEDERTVSAYTLLSDVRGRQSILLKVTSTKVFLIQEKQTLLFAVLANTTIGLLLALVVLVLLQKHVISRINSLVQQVTSIRYSNNFSSRVGLTGNDEVGVLASAFNQTIAQMGEMASKIKESEKRYSMLIEQSHDGVVILVGDVIKFANRRFAEMLGYVNEKKIKGSILDLLAPLERKQFSERLKIKRTKKVIIESFGCVMLTNKDIEIEVEIDIVPSFYQDDKALFLYIRDITDKKRMEQQLSRIDKLASLGKLSSGIAHEIRTPLGSIQLNIDNILQNSKLVKDDKHLLKNCSEAVERISEIVQRTLDFARPVQPNFEPIRITEILENALTLMSSHLRNINIKVERDYEQQIPLLNGDRGQLVQVALNIMLNSVQAMPHGGNLRLWVSNKKHESMKFVELGIEDSGSGIEQENMRRVFDPFFTTKHEGVGLGLSIVHRILEQHNARVDVKSKTGKGSAFIIQFPVNSKN